MNGGEKMKVKLKDKQAFEVLIAEKGFSKNSLSLKIKKTNNCVYLVVKRGSCRPNTANIICEALGVNFHDVFLLEPLTKVDNQAS